MEKIEESEEITIKKALSEKSQEDQKSDNPKMRKEPKDLDKTLESWAKKVEAMVKEKLNITKDLSKQILDVSRFTNLLIEKENTYTAVSTNLIELIKSQKDANTVGQPIEEVLS